MNYKDQLGHTLHFNTVPKRIVSIVPSQSEFLWELGLREELVGITKFCVHPAQMFKTITRVGGTKKLDIKKIRALNPDLIIGNREENDKRQIEELSKEFKVWMSDIFTFADAFGMMRELGKILGRQEGAAKIVSEIRTSVTSVRNVFHGESVAYFIWKDPYMLAAKDTFIDHVLNYVGLKNVSQNTRYPEISGAELKKLDPQLCFLSSEPYPFKEKHVSEIQDILPNAKILIVDGEMFSWYGSRLLHLENYVQNLRPSIFNF